MSRNAGGRYIEDMPVMSEGKKNKRQLNSALLAQLVKENVKNIEDTIMVVEQVNAMPGQGVTSMFNFGQTFGAIKGILLYPFIRTNSSIKSISCLRSGLQDGGRILILFFPAFILHPNEDNILFVSVGVIEKPITFKNLS